MGKMESERVVVSAPMSFGGSKTRLMNLLWRDKHPALLATVSWWALPMALIAVWIVVACWYLVFGLFMAPYRLLRRGSRKRKRDEARHREVLDAARQGRDDAS